MDSEYEAFSTSDLVIVQTFTSYNYVVSGLSVSFSKLQAPSSKLQASCEYDTPFLDPLFSPGDSEGVRVDPFGFRGGSFSDKGKSEVLQARR